MSPGSRIIFNTLATYGRSVCAMVLGLFSARWVLAALGQNDFGIYGVVGTLIVLVGLLNGIMSTSVSRYYAYAIGETHDGENAEGLECLRRWFNAAVTIHSVLPVVLIFVGYPIGVYALRHWLTLPADRIPAAVMVFRLALFSAFVNMISVPYIAMYQAKQLIAELAFWNLLTAFATFVCAYGLLSYRGDCLVAYGAYMTMIPVIIQTMQVWRAHRQFAACRIRLRYLGDRASIRKLFAFASGEFFGWLGGAIRDNGMTILINLKLGLMVNAAYTIANQVSSQTASLSSAMVGALVPAVTSAEGAGDHERALRLSYQSIKFGVLLILLFCIPLMLEIDTVLALWLVNPPPHTATLCRCVLLALVCHKFGWGFHLAILARGRVVGYQVVVGLTSALGLVLACVMVSLGVGALGVGLSLIITFIVMTAERAIAARQLCGVSIPFWLYKIVAPVFMVGVVAWLMGILVCCTIPSSITRVILTIIFSTGTLAIASWIVLVEDIEKARILAIVHSVRTALAI